jgi:hypothetical protein
MADDVDLDIVFSIGGCPWGNRSLTYHGMLRMSVYGSSSGSAALAFLLLRLQIVRSGPGKNQEPDCLLNMRQ